jgi:hypothetical protein
MASLTTECHIITCYSQDDHMLELDYDNTLTGRYSQDGQVDLGTNNFFNRKAEMSYFEAIESKVSQWIKSSLLEQKRTDLITAVKVNVSYHPLCIKALTSNLFLLPHPNIFPQFSRNLF